MSSDSLTFLDIDVFITNNLIKHKINVKPTNSFQYLHSESSHLLYMNKYIPQSLATRATKLWSEEEHLQEIVTQIK